MSRDLDTILNDPAPVSVTSQATAIESVRAAAEVRAAVMVAQDCPRSITKAQKQMAESCAQIVLAEHAFFRLPKGNSTVTGPTIHLARELARCWGNIQYGITELSRDTRGGQSEAVSWAWDVEANTRVSSSFIMPHRRQKRGVVGGELLTEVADIYELFANLGNRRVRECIFGVLPRWFVEDAKARCNATLESGGGDIPLAQRIASMVAGFANLGVSENDLETKWGRKVNDWTPRDLAQAGIVGRALSNNETTREQEFPTAAVDRDELAPERPAKAKPKAESPTEPPAAQTPLQAAAAASWGDQ